MLRPARGTAAEPPARARIIAATKPGAGINVSDMVSWLVMVSEQDARTGRPRPLLRGEPTDRGEFEIKGKGSRRGCAPMLPRGLEGRLRAAAPRCILHTHAAVREVIEPHVAPRRRCLRAARAPLPAAPLRRRQRHGCQLQSRHPARHRHSECPLEPSGSRAEPLPFAPRRARGARPRPPAAICIGLSRLVQPFTRARGVHL
jgi:hypothetical protein